jgi:hydrogenase maturation protease
MGRIVLKECFMILIIGYGNRLRRDDGVGPTLAKTIQENEQLDDIRVIETHQLVPELAEEMAASDVTAVIFMDASVASGKLDASDIMAGLEVRRLDSVAATPSFSHQCDPSTLLLYCALLYAKKPPAWLVSIPGVDFTYGQGFSEVALHSLAIAQDKVLDLLYRLRTDRLPDLPDFHQTSV